MSRISIVFGPTCVLVGLAGLLLCGGCAAAALNAGFGGPGDFGATQGGVQDLGLARALIESGRVPPPEAFVVEGMFSEHDLGLSGQMCERTLCLRAAMGVAPTLDGTSSGWLQVGLSSTIDPDTYERPSVTLIATVDVSGSMGWDYATAQTEYPTPGALTRNLLRAITAELGTQDRLAIVIYSRTASTLLPLTNGDEHAVVESAIDSLTTGGATAMEAGLAVAYELARGVNLGETEEIRVMLFTDVRPNVGATTPTAFEQLVGAGAEDGIGLTIMAAGVGLGQEVLNAMAHLRGGNAFTVFDYGDITETMEDDWPYLLSPIAYDMVVNLSPSAGLDVADAYGCPSGDDEAATRMEVSSVFLSRRKGALLVRFTTEEGTELAGLQVGGHLTYETPDGELVEEEIVATYTGQPLDDHGQYFEQVSVGKTVALAVLVSAMAEAAEQYQTDRESAITTMRMATDRFTADAESLADEALAPEVELARELLSLMQQGAEQGDLYGIGR